MADSRDVLMSEGHDIINCRLNQPDEGCLEIENENTEVHKVSLWKQIRTYGCPRIRIVHTVLIAWFCFSIGWRLAMIGPTFPDVQQIIGADVSMGSWLFTAFYIGNVGGCLAAGCMYDRFSKLVVIFSCMILLSLSTAVIPWCASFTTMFVAHVASGASYGASDVVTITDVSYVWSSQAAKILQLTQFMHGLGAIIGPLVVAPFLSEQTNDQRELVMTTNNLTNLTNDRMVAFLQTKLIENVTLQVPETGIGDVKDPAPERVRIAYSIAALLSLVNAMAFLPHIALNKDVYRRFGRDTYSNNCCKSEPRKSSGNKFSKRTIIFFVCALAILSTLQLLIGRNFVSYFTRYVTKKKGWSKTGGSTATSVYYVAVALGRLTSSIILGCVSLTNAIFLYLVLTTLALIIFLCASVFDSNFAIWISIVLLGYALGPIFPACFSWLSKNVVLASGKFTGAMYLTGVSTCCFFPPLIGYLMETYTYDWFLYILLILDPVMLITFLAVVVIHRRLMNKN